MSKIEGELPISPWSSRENSLSSNFSDSVDSSCCHLIGKHPNDLTSASVDSKWSDSWSDHNTQTEAPQEEIEKLEELALRNGKSEPSSDRLAVSLYKPAKMQQYNTQEPSDRDLVLPQRSYETEFEELEVLGSGAYGSVFRTLHKLDGTEYAVKKVVLPSLNHSNLIGMADTLTRQEEESTRCLREARAMASICHHKNIVRYYQAWLELIPAGADTMGKLNFKSASKSINLIDTDSDSAIEKIDEYSQKLFKNDFPSQSSDSFPVGIDESSCESTATSNLQLSMCRPISHQKLTSSLVLYIQMELCNGSTLFEWLRTPGRTINTIENRKLFHQLLAGVEHIHNKGFCHRDLKPANILIVPSKHGPHQLKVADFGNCKRVKRNNSADFFPPVDRPAPHPSPATVSNNDHTSGCGTYLYMAPECYRSAYDESVDIFAMGIILFEMYHLFSTEMERVSMITDLREKRILDPAFALSYPEEASLILLMTNPNPTERPTSWELMASAQYGFYRVEEVSDSSDWHGVSSQSPTLQNFLDTQASSKSFSDPIPSNRSSLKNSSKEQLISIIDEKEKQIRDQSAIIEKLKLQLKSSHQTVPSEHSSN